MKGPEATRARPLAERFADLESRIQALEAKAQATPGEHTVADLINDLRNRRDVVRGHLAESPETHAAATKDPSNTRDAERKASDGQTPAEAAYRDLEDAYERALTRFR
ncbi:MAG: hypothetical protein VR70_02810 [Rhodospirillaceae bacterium BRH_c57]|nr:MAG: hypothetical protein VR70_02810 [Rhodospirillaceae bacterium BRH_c57]